jgi:hypothetical protein
MSVLLLNNAAGSRNIALSLSDDKTLAIRDTVAAVNRIEDLPYWRYSYQSFRYRFISTVYYRDSKNGGM